MPFPTDWASGTVKGHFVDLSGNNAVGTITFEPVPPRIQSPAEDYVVLSIPQVITLVNGAFSVSLKSTDDPDTNPTGVTYQVTEEIVGRVALTYQMSVPGGVETDLADIALIDPEFGQVTIIGPEGPMGPPGDGALEFPEYADGVGTRYYEGDAGLVKPDHTGHITNFVGFTSRTATVTTDQSMFLADADKPTLTANQIRMAGASPVSLMAIHFRMAGNYVNNTGANRNAVFRLKRGTTTICAFVFNAIPTGAQPRSWYVDAFVEITDFFGTNTRGGGRMTMGGIQSAAGGAGIPTALDFGSSTDQGDVAAFDATAIQRFDFTVAFSAVDGANAACTGAGCHAWLMRGVAL
jgi:hypothetical protein